MEYNEAKEKFIHTWGILGSSWGINKTMAQIQALLLISTEPLSTEEIMKELSISRGNANMNIRTLIDWGIVDKELKPGERKEFFSSEKDVWHIAMQVAKQRKKKELEPLLKVLEQLNDVKGTGEKEKLFRSVTKDINKLGSQVDQVLDKITKAEQNWLMGSILKLMK